MVSVMYAELVGLLIFSLFFPLSGLVAGKPVISRYAEIARADFFNKLDTWGFYQWSPPRNSMLLDVSNT